MITMLALSLTACAGLPKPTEDSQPVAVETKEGQVIRVHVTVEVEPVQ